MLSMMDKLWHPDLGEQEALELMKKGVDEVKKRLVVAPPDYQIKVGCGRGKLPGCPPGLSILMLRGRASCGAAVLSVKFCQEGCWLADERRTCAGWHLCLSGEAPQ